MRQGSHIFQMNGYCFSSVLLYSKIMLSLIAISGQKKMLQTLMQLKLASKEPLELEFLDYFIANNMKTSRSFTHFLRLAKKVTLTPHAILKLLMLIHTYLQNFPKIEEETLIAFINYLLFQCTNFIRMNGEAETPQTGKDLKSTKNSTPKFEMSTRQQEVALSKEVLIYNIAKTYIRYLLKIVSIYQDFKRISARKEQESHFVWMMINLLTSISTFSSQFTLVGRYFMREYGGLIASAIEVITKDVVRLTKSIKQYVFIQNRLLSCSASSSSKEIEEFVKMLDEISSLNQVLAHIYMGKYFYEVLMQIPQPEWIQTNSKEFDSIFKFAEGHSKRQENEVNFKGGPRGNEKDNRRVKVAFELAE